MTIDLILEAVGLVANIQSIAALFIGVTIGVVVGAIPGMSTTMAVALTLPFTFTLDPVTGILLLLGVYKGGIFGGSLTAILIKAPGTPAASCTVLDGWPLMQKGQGRKALDMALFASCTADFISNLALILLAGVLASFALSFGPPEFFTLIVFSLTIIASVSGDQIAKGLVAAGLGLLLATVGLDLIYGTERFVYGNVDLMSGFSLVPVLIGLFALPEIIAYFVRRPEGAGTAAKLEAVGLKWHEYKSSLRTIIKGSFIGCILGAIPGLGAAPAAFLSYGEAQRSSKNSKNFGKGELEGVAASEAGNSGVAGSTMIPLLALGIPGDVITAILLGAFMIHGLKPGPLLFEQNLSLVYALFIGIMLSSPLLLIVGKIASRYIGKVATMPYSLLYPVVFVLCAYGAFAINNSLFDVTVMVTMGILGFVMMQLSIPAAAFLIAFVLGPLLEDNFRQAMLMSGSDPAIFFRSGICWFFWALTVASVYLAIRRGSR